MEKRDRNPAAIADRYIPKPNPDMVTANRAVALAAFQDEMTEQVHFAMRRFGKQSMREAIAQLRYQADRFEEHLLEDESSYMYDKQQRLEACIAMAVLAFRCHYGD